MIDLSFRCGNFIKKKYSRGLKVKLQFRETRVNSFGHVSLFLATLQLYLLRNRKRLDTD